MGKFTINGPFSIAMLNYQRVTPVFYVSPSFSQHFPMDFPMDWPPGLPENGARPQAMPMGSQGVFVGNMQGPMGPMMS